jgi:membrane associated rhomboid family serine protease
MIPLRDTVPSRTHPVVNNLIIGINIVVFMVEIAQGAGLERFIYIYGLVPARYSVPQIASYFTMQQQVFSLLSFMFLHGGFLHLLSNMWFLYIFGNNVEDRLGHLRYIFFYLLCGLASGLVHLLLNLGLNIPTIGASGAIAGVMGAYFILYPRSRILTLIPIFFIPYFIEIPAFFFLGLWLIMQILQAAGADAHVSGIAWWAHIGGFVFGIIFLKIFLALPSTGITEKVRRVTERKKTHRLQVIRPTGPGDDPHLYGIIVITSYEASAGTRKLVNIPWGFHSRLYRVLVPPDTKEGDMLKLKGLGKQMPDGQTGDLFLKVAIRNG